MIGYATASTEGRIAVEYFDPSSAAQDKKYAFKSHRQTIEDVDHVWPVNALAFHPIYNTFASAGSDGILSIWDHKVKKRLKQYQKYKTAISSIGFNCDGAKLAIGVSYTWDEGEEGAKGAERPAIYIKSVGDDFKVRRLSLDPSIYMLISMISLAERLDCLMRRIIMYPMFYVEEMCRCFGSSISKQPNLTSEMVQECVLGDPARSE